MIKFNRYYVTNGTTKARVSYSLDNHVNGLRCVTLYAKDYSDALGVIFRDIYVNETDFQTDYFDKGRVRMFEDHPCYAAARARAEAIENAIADRATNRLLSGKPVVVNLYAR